MRCAADAGEALASATPNTSAAVMFVKLIMVLSIVVGCRQPGALDMGYRRRTIRAANAGERMRARPSNVTLRTVHGAVTLVSRFRSSHTIAVTSDANFGIERDTSKHMKLV